jgi:TonB family protein
MRDSILEPHVREGSYRRALGLSIAAHLLLGLLLLFGPWLLPAGTAIRFGTGPGGGQGGDYVTVGLTPQLSGGAGMYKPAITPRPTAVPPPAPKEQPKEPEPRKADEPDPNDFVQKSTRTRRTPPTTPPASKGATKAPAQAAPGQIPTTPEPGAGGPGGASGGSGGGFGGGIGVQIGAGTGEGSIDSWYVRQVEQRIGGNWLKTTLGQLDRPVESIVSFEVEPNGTISNVRLEKKSGIMSVDLAAERAVRASNPLPPLPYELRGRRVRFSAHFDYPPR